MLRRMAQALGKKELNYFIQIYHKSVAARKWQKVKPTVMRYRNWLARMNEPVLK